MQQDALQRPRLFAFDINSHFVRTYKKLVPGEKEPIGASAYYNNEPVFCLKPMLKLIEREMKDVRELGFENSHVVFVFDHDGLNFRHGLYPDYKANRPVKPYSWTRQLELAFEMLTALGYTCLRVQNVESDDVLATLGMTLSKHNVEVVIFSGDKDVMSCCNEYVRVYDGKQRKLISASDIPDRFGVPAERLLDLLALMGDSADNVPGAAGIGSGNGAKILANYSLEQVLVEPEIIRNIELRGKDGVIRSLVENHQIIKLSKQLVSLKTDVTLGINFRDMVRKPPNYQQFLDGYLRPQV